MAEAADALRKNWLAALAHERRASPHTLRAYGDDVARFIGFQAIHTGGAGSDSSATRRGGSRLDSTNGRISPLVSI